MTVTIKDGLFVFFNTSSNISATFTDVEIVTTFTFNTINTSIKVRLGRIRNKAGLKAIRVIKNYFRIERVGKPSILGAIKERNKRDAKNIRVTQARFRR